MTPDQSNVELLRLQLDRLELQLKNRSRDLSAYAWVTVMLTVAFKTQTPLTRWLWLTEFEHRLVFAAVIAGLLMTSAAWLRDRFLRRRYDDQRRQIHLSITPTVKSP